MLEDYVEFANAYFRYIYNYTKNHYYSQEYEINLQKEYSVEKTNWYLQIPNTLFDRFKNKKYTIKRFNEFVELIGLKSYKYKKYIKNYEARLSCYKNKEVKMDFNMTKDFPWPNRTYSGEKQDGGIEFKKSIEPANLTICDGETNVCDSMETTEIEIVLDSSELVNSIVNTESVSTSHDLTINVPPVEIIDPIKRLNMLSKRLAQELLINLEENPRDGRKIMIKTTW
jgi:hypothetical protein